MHHYLRVITHKTLQNKQLIQSTRNLIYNMDLSDIERYSISKINEDTFVLTDSDTLQTWQIEILRNSYKETDSDSAQNTPNPENK